MGGGEGRREDSRSILYFPEESWPGAGRNDSSGAWDSFLWGPGLRYSSSWHSTWNSMSAQKYSGTLLGAVTATWFRVSWAQDSGCVPALAPSLLRPPAASYPSVASSRL